MGSSRPWELPCPCASCQKCLLFQSVICALRLPLLDCTCCFSFQLVSICYLPHPSAFTAWLSCFVVCSCEPPTFPQTPGGVCVLGPRPSALALPSCFALPLAALRPLARARLCLASAAFPACFPLPLPSSFCFGSEPPREKGPFSGFRLPCGGPAPGHSPRPSGLVALPHGLSLSFCLCPLLPGRRPFACLCRAAAAILFRRPSAIFHRCPLCHVLPSWAYLLLALAVPALSVLLPSLWNSASFS